MNACLLDMSHDQARPHRWTMAATIVVTSLAFFVAGCTAPPSVLPLLDASERAMALEITHLATDQERDAQWIAQTRRSLEQAYEADLAQVEVLTPQWVHDATSVYVLAREALVRHEVELLAQRQQRMDNLQAAAEAVQRARAVLQQQDRLWTDLAGVNDWKLLSPYVGDPHP